MDFIRGISQTYAIYKVTYCPNLLYIAKPRVLYSLFIDCEPLVLYLDVPLMFPDAVSNRYRLVTQITEFTGMRNRIYADVGCWFETIENAVAVSLVRS